MILFQLRQTGDYQGEKREGQGQFLGNILCPRNWSRKKSHEGNKRSGLGNRDRTKRSLEAKGGGSCKKKGGQQFQTPQGFEPQE